MTSSGGLRERIPKCHFDLNFFLFEVGVLGILELNTEILDGALSISSPIPSLPSEFFFLKAKKKVYTNIYT